jgi:hypothetical protein
LIAYIPIVKFDKTRTAVQTAYQARLFHQCLEYILQPLVEAGSKGVLMIDSSGNKQLCFPRLAAYIADLPEQCLINLTVPNVNPSTQARHHDLGDRTKHPPRKREWILSEISSICDIVDPDDVPAYIKVAKERGFNGVHQLFWADLPGYEAEFCLSPDILHGVHRFWRDHILNWVLEMVGSVEVDKRLRALQPVVGMRHFHTGIHSLAQWTGPEDRELQRVLLAVIAGAPDVDEKAMACLRAFHDFVYLTQYQSHQDATLGYLHEKLDTFHKLKGIFIQNGARRGKKEVIPHFYIPKLANLHLYKGHIVEMGSSPQFSTEVTETYHQEMAKKAYRSTNKKDYEIQMVRRVDRGDRIFLMNELLSYQKDLATQGALRQHMTGLAPMYQETLLRLAEKAVQRRKIRDGQPTITRPAQHQRRITNSSLAWISTKPHRTYGNLKEMARAYNLSDLEQRMRECYRVLDEADTSNPVWLKVHVWENFHIQLPTVQDGQTIASAQMGQAIPPSKTLPFRRRDCVLVVEDDEAEETGIQGDAINNFLFKKYNSSHQQVIELCKSCQYLLWSYR